MSSYRISDIKEKYYSDSYGVKVSKENGKFKYSGPAEQVSKVSAMIKKDKFYHENKNKIPKFTSKKGSLSSQLVDYDTSSDYDSVKGSSFSYNSYEKTYSFS
jgi:enterochelin esterase-like enzyme